MYKKDLKVEEDPLKTIFKAVAKREIQIKDKEENLKSLSNENEDRKENNVFEVN